MTVVNTDFDRRFKYILLSFLEGKLILYSPSLFTHTDERGLYFPYKNNSCVRHAITLSTNKTVSISVWNKRGIYPEKLNFRSKHVQRQCEETLRQPYSLSKAMFLDPKGYGCQQSFRLCRFQKRYTKQKPLVPRPTNTCVFYWANTQWKRR